MSMKCVVAVIALTGAICAGTQSLAVDSPDVSRTSKRQMIVQMVGCVRKRISANKSGSYNDALRACKKEQAKESDKLPSGALVASDTPAKP